MKYFAVIDTNVLVSAALKPNSNPGTIFRLIEGEVVVPLINDEILDEYTKVLSRPKFGFPKDVVYDIVESISKNAITVAENHIDIQLPDEKDRVFYEVVMKSNETRTSRLATGNMKHFPAEPFIITPKEFCELVLKDIGNA